MTQGHQENWAKSMCTSFGEECNIDKDLYTRCMNLVKMSFMDRPGGLKVTFIKKISINYVTSA